MRAHLFRLQAGAHVSLCYQSLTFSSLTFPIVR